MLFLANLSGTKTEEDGYSCALTLSGNNMIEKILNSPLDKIHQTLNANMMNFAGWNMPIQYPAGVIQEHLCVRNARDRRRTSVCVFRQRRGLQSESRRRPAVVSAYRGVRHARRVGHSRVTGVVW